MKNIDIDEMKRIQLNILVDVAEFCDKHNLSYFLSGGSMLGAIRHKGFIPWDDDIDVIMFRKDFEKLNEILENNLDEKYNYVPGQTWYGWVHVSIDENLEMTLLGDGINLYGGAVTVGATPEPVSGLLLLVGALLLALRRRRGLW